MRSIPVLKLTYLLTFFAVLLLSACQSVLFESSPLAESRFDTARKVIITADDFGASAEINAGIIRGVETGFVNTVSAMVTFPGAPAEIADLKTEFPGINIGLHLSVTSGFPVSDKITIPSLIDEDGSFYSIDKLILRLDEVDLAEIESELRRQIEIFQLTGVKIDHLSSQHNILHLYSPFTELVMNLAVEYNLPMRATRAASVVLDDFSYSKTRERGLDLAGLIIRQNPFGALGFMRYTRGLEMSENQQRMSEILIPHPDYLIDSFWGTPTAENLYYIFTHLPEGTSEIIFHLGVNEDEGGIPPGIEGGYYLMREFELMSINNREIERWMHKLNITKTSFSELKKGTSYLKDIPSVSICELIF